MKKITYISNGIWTKKEIEFLKENYGKIYCKDIAIQLNRSYHSIFHKANDLNLKSKLRNVKAFITWNKNKKGKTYEELYGEDKAKEVKLKKSLLLLGNTNSLGYKHTDEAKQKMSKQRKGKKFSEEHKIKISEGHLNRTNKDKSITMKKILSKRKIYPNEEKLLKIIEKNNFPFNYTGNGKIIINGFCPDFLSKNPKHIIELFSSRHYSNYDKKRDKRRIESYSLLGYKTLIINNWELKDENKIINKIRNFINQK